MPVCTTPDTAIHLGVSWYPECWPAEEWPKDIAKMQEAGMTLVRLFEFAWKKFEPQEGEYDFSWAINILDQLHAAGIQAMIGTPTAAPPAWLTTAYPETLGVNKDQKQKTHGKRKHYNHHSVLYRGKAVAIVTKMVEAFGNHPAVHSWQIDNEMGGYDYGPETTQHFHRWMEDRYGTIEQLNETWGLQFWSQAYDSFEQIPLCTAEVGSRTVPERHHPSLIIAIARFQNEAWTSFISAQAEVIRQQCSHPITTNMTGAISAMDWFKHFRVLDRSGASMYSDLNYYHYNYMRFDRLRAEKEQPYWLLETAPNWSGGGPIWNIHHDERGIKAFSWLSVLLGGSMVLYWQWRSHWAGQEMQHGTCVNQTGAWQPGKDAWQQLSKDFATHGEFLINNPAQRANIALVASCESAWSFAIDPIDPKANNYLETFRDDLHVPLVNAHLHRDVIDADADYSPYQLMVMQRLPMLNEAAKSRLREWVAGGGTVILGPMTGTRSEEMTAWIDQAFGGLEELMGADNAIRFSPHWVENTIDVAFTDGSSCHPKIWCEGLSPRDGTEVLAQYRGGYGDGHAAITSHQYGKGRVIAVGCPLSSERMVQLISDTAQGLGIEALAAVSEAAEGVLTCPRADSDGTITAVGLVNTRKEPRTITLTSGGGTDMLSGEQCAAEIVLAPLQVRLIRLAAQA